MQRRGIERRRRGFSLVEAIAALVIVGVAVPPMLWSVRQASRHRIDPALASRARWLATEKLEEIVSVRHAAERGWDALTPGNFPAEACVPGFESYSRRVELRETGPDLRTPGRGYRVVTVEVGWEDASGGRRTVSISTVVCEFES